MTYLVWEKQLLGYLKNQPAEDKKQIVDYYREMYYDKIERGASPEQVLSEFGDPQSCAARILMEHEPEANEPKLDFRDEHVAPKNNPKPPKFDKPQKKFTVGGVVGWFFITVLLLIPLGAAAISVVASFAATAFSGFAMILAGAIAAIISPIGLFFGWSVSLMLAGIGASIAVVGVGAILATVFSLLTKYTALGLYKAVVILIKGRA